MERELTWSEFIDIATYSFTCTMLLGILLVLA